MSRTMVLVSAVFLALSACQPAPPAVDLEAARQSLLDADRAWSEKTTGTPEEFVAVFAEDGKIFPAGAPLQSGKANLQQFATELMGLPGFALSWSATDAHVASSGDFGYTEGSYELTMTGPDGNPVTDRGKYVTIWRKEADGTWKVAADIFNSDAPPPAPEPAPGPAS